MKCCLTCLDEVEPVRDADVVARECEPALGVRLVCVLLRVAHFWSVRDATTDEAPVIKVGTKVGEICARVLCQR